MRLQATIVRAKDARAVTQYLNFTPEHLAQELQAKYLSGKLIGKDVTVVKEGAAKWNSKK